MNKYFKSQYALRITPSVTKQTSRSVIQSMIFFIRNTPHAIVNLEENISVTENIFTPDALEDYMLR